MNELKQAVLRTLIYFDIFDYPLTLMEVWKWLNITNYTRITHEQDTNGSRITHGYKLNDIQEAIGQILNKIKSKNGFYFLLGRESIIEERLRRYGYAEAKYRRAIKFVKIFRSIPFIKMMAVCNTLAYSNSMKEGDIDLFIIAKKNRLWLTRLLVVGLLKILGVRPSDTKKQDTIDANFFLAEDNLNLESIKISQDDIYLTYWIDQLVPIYDVENTYQKFQEANQWIKKTLPNSAGYQINDRRKIHQNWFSKIGSFKLKLLLDWQLFENLLRKYQLKIMPSILKEMMNKDTRVIVNNKMLKFHRDDRREEYQAKFNCHFD